MTASPKLIDERLHGGRTSRCSLGSPVRVDCRLAEDPRFPRLTPPEPRKQTVAIWSRRADPNRRALDELFGSQEGSPPGAGERTRIADLPNTNRIRAGPAASTGVQIRSIPSRRAAPHRGCGAVDEALPVRASCRGLFFSSVYGFRFSSVH